MPNTCRTPSVSSAAATASPPVISMAVLPSEADRDLQGAIGPVVRHLIRLLDLVDGQQMAEQRGHVDRAVVDQPHRVPERSEPGFALRAGDRVAGEELAEELAEGER